MPSTVCHEGHLLVLSSLLDHRGCSYVGYITCVWVYEYKRDTFRETVIVAKDPEVRSGAEGSMFLARWGRGWGRVVVVLRGHDICRRPSPDKAL